MNNPQISRTDLVENLKEILTCPVCLEEFRKPKVLACGHSFCEVCIKTSVEAAPAQDQLTILETDTTGYVIEQRTSLRCFVCRQLCIVPGGRVENLTSPQVLTQILHEILKNQPAQLRNETLEANTIEPQLDELINNIRVTIVQHSLLATKLAKKLEKLTAFTARAHYCQYFITKEQIHKLLLQALQQHPNNISIQNYCLISLSHLAVYAVAKRPFREVNVHSVVLGSLRRHIDIPSIQIHGIAVIANLAVLSSYRAVLVNSGAHDHILRAMRSHKSNESIQEAGCSVLAQIAALESVTPLLCLAPFSAHTRITKALKKYPQNVELQLAGIGALAALACCSINVPLLQSIGTTELVETIASRFPRRDDLQESVVIVISRLVLS